MKKIHILLGTALSLSTLFTSCKKDEVTPAPTTTTYSVPTNYEFKNASNVSTVDFSGQKTRLVMLDQISSLMGGTSPVSEATLLSMYDGTGFTVDSLNQSGKKLSDKTASSIDYFSGINTEQTEIRDKFKALFKDAELLTTGSTEASVGVAGYYMDGTKKRYFNANGLSPQQVFAKGMMGACLLDQVLNTYLSTTKLDAGSNKANNTSKILESGKTYTTMEHFWDEAYGYIYGNDNPTATAPIYKFWSSYINKVNSDPNFNTVKDALYKAFIKGRAAISNGDYTTRDAQIAIIKTELSKVTAVTAVNYLAGEGKTKLGKDNGKAAFHALSEGYGFIWCLRFTQNPTTKAPYFSKEEVDVMLADLMKGKNGLYDVDYLSTVLDSIATKIATRFGFTVEQAKDATK
jgi:hypothetical protein